MNIIIPASGIGKRFIDAGYTDTKPLIDVTSDKKIIDYVVDMFDRDDDTFIFITSPTTFNEMQSYIDSMNIKYHHFLSTGPKNGPVGAVADVYLKIEEVINKDEPVIVSYCDYGCEWDYKHFKDFVKLSGADAAIPCYSGYHPHLEPKENVYAACKVLDDNMTVIAVKEKYDSQQRFEEKWSPGSYYFKTFNLMKHAFDELMKAGDTLNDEYYVSMAYNYIVDDYRVLCYNMIDKFYQFGTPKDFEYAKNKINTVKNLGNCHAKIKNTVVLAAGKGERFLNVGYTHPKPFIPLNGSDFVSAIKDSFKPVETNITFVGSDAHSSYWQNYNVNLIASNKIGAAYSYKEGCGDITGETLIVPCDLIASHVTPQFLKVKEDADFIIFTAEPSNYALENKNSFAWVGGSNNKIDDISIKETTDLSTMVLIGSFWVRENQELINAINKIFELEYTVNGEYYLDNAFKLLHDEGFNVKYVKLDNYLSFGTPNEYYENKYWYEN